MTLTPSIFVLIASYRDPECQWTVRDLFQKAARPDRIRVGICWQADPDKDRHCFEVETRPGQVEAVHFRPEQSKGLGWARAQAQALLRDEDYALQIDSHMRFEQDWDERMLAVLAQCDSEKPILTVYPPGYTPPDRLDPDPKPRVQCAHRFDRSGILFYSAKRPPSGVRPTAPMATACLAGGFVFGPADWLRVMAHDPEIYFNGEEHALAARLWTHGFDLFSPHEPLVYHYYSREESPKLWTDDPKTAKKHRTTLLRLRQMLAPSTVPERDRVDLGIHGLGTERSLSDYETYAGVNFAARSIASYARSFPYVHSADIVATLRTEQELGVSPEAALFIVDDEGLLFSAARGEIYHLNNAATYVWCAMEAGATWDELVEGLVDYCAMPAADAENTLANLVVHWRGQGVLRGNETDAQDAALAPSREVLPSLGDETSIASPAAFAAQREQHYRLLDSLFCVRFAEPEHVDWLMPALTHLETTAGWAPDHLITVHREGEAHHIFQDGHPVVTGVPIAQLAPFLKNQIVRTALERYDHILNLHAGVVAKGDALIALPAESGDGKSTLVAGLITRGYRYFSDELAPLSGPSCEVVPVPLGVCIKDTAFPTLQAYYPEIRNQPLHDRVDGRRAVYLPPADEAIAVRDQTRPISHLVFPRYQAGAATTMKPIRRVEAFARALEQCVSIPKPLTLEDAAALVGWIEQVQCYDLVSGSLEAMMDQIDRMLVSRTDVPD